MNAIGSVAAAIFGVFWTIQAVSMGAPIFFALFGVMFVVLAVVQGIYHYNNATGKNRMSLYDITDDDEENEYSQNNYTGENTKNKSLDTRDVKFCPYCGVKLEEEFSFCPKCGKRIRG
jgi:ABC-type transport system involved in multi-copper enzyme maturation permease subunit